MTESGTILREAPLDDITGSSIKQTKKLLPYEPLREADVFWKKRVWRVIDVREKNESDFYLSCQTSVPNLPGCH